MEIKITEHNGVYIAEVISDQVEVSSGQDALDIMMSCAYQGAEHIIWHQRNIHPDFFDLKTRLAGEVLQKASNYRIRLAIIGHFDDLSNKSLRDFILESNRMGRVVFVSNVDSATRMLADKGMS
ncbi:MAG: DUF4180 domain-containing protein [Flavobacteriales bacterium]